MELLVLVSNGTLALRNALHTGWNREHKNN